jgi:CheY-like chemotaxis protein
VDDNPVGRRLMIPYLESLGYGADEFEWWRRASEQGPLDDLVIIDLRMPGIDGPQAASLIRDSSQSSERPWIIAVSASLQENEVKRARDSGVNDFLGKPFYAGQLAEKIREIPWFDEMEVDLVASAEGVERVSQQEPQHVPLFIGPASPEEHEAAVAEIEQKARPIPPAPDSVFSGIGSYPPEVVKAAIDEVYSKHDAMSRNAMDGDWGLVREDAHYLANTAMALGIDQLYLDSKDLEAAAEAHDADKVSKALRELRLNFEAWEQDE